ncbi:MAG: DUF4301 family protein [Bacteroidales bacterium]|jgi:hypothetical protein|nr:DUF4301 family protein [Bacteroidales bacterium]NCU36040.1 DUF4301 family protein [Candidatus Falkowbacteria bacterium]MDD2633307.1 DUF4301 family protein [Bacteroidales bacterium]MDD3526249.1 DUF4301 family protein [Bacteroidales bacterium]MDD4177937.1 DUF4301 family protein [Bacteroidales bacterium]
MLNEKDFRQIEEKGISRQQIDQQIENFKKGFPTAQLTAAATPGDGIRVFDEKDIKQLAGYYDLHSSEHRLLKFVPASGAATRMFKHLFEFAEKYSGSDEEIATLQNQKGTDSTWHFLQNIDKYAFADDLRAALHNAGHDLDALLQQKKYDVVVQYLLDDKGLGYANLPKGLLKFHQYPDASRRALEEHLVEGAHYVADAEGVVQLHFTVSPEHRERFEQAVAQASPEYEKRFGVKYQITFSEQKPSTDTIAVDMNNEPFRDADGSLVFRPGGHGALIENLNDLKGDIIFIKNIDNIVPDRLKEVTHLYKKAIGGLLLKLKAQVDEYLQQLEGGDVSKELFDEIIAFAKKDLMIQLSDDFDKLSSGEKRDKLFGLLNRPMRIAGMVKNEGEPGGGPFWVRNEKGEVSLQIVESSQMDMNNPQQKKLVSGATHFNPVDLVCSVRDYRGENFDLHHHIDASTGFISKKSKDGKDLKAQELPGLWNGAMADWITLFVEVPIDTFNPVKTVNDLLRPQHLNA